ncbi:MAG: cyclic nucleotide-binding domain-containing protein [Fimbriimonadaceae bacterium]|nr:cyclic nucleotide-binding domain-containing protein [Fimbriimonadaceae bacterium]
MSLNEQQLAAFTKSYFVAGLNEEQLARVAALGRVNHLVAGEAIVQVGEKSGDLFVVLDGKITIRAADGDELASVGPPSVIGEMSLIDDQPRSASAICVTLCTLVRFEAKPLRRLMWQDKEVGFVVLSNLARVLITRLKQANEKVDVLMDKVDPWEHAL